MRSLTLAGVMLALAAGSALAQQPPAKPPAVGIIVAMRQPVTQSSEYVGRIQATDRVNIVARVAAFLDQRLFAEGTEVKKGDLLYRLERGPFVADVQAKQSVVAQNKAQHENAVATLSRAKSLLNTPAGLSSSVITANANELALQAQIAGAEAQLQQAQINLGYTEIRAPIDGKIGRTAVTAGNLVGPNSGVLTTIVSQDPMYVVFSVSSRTAIELSRRAGEKPGADAAVIKVRLPDGRIYGETGKLDFIDNSVAGATDTITLRGFLKNPPRGDAAAGAASRELVDGEFVTVILEDAQPIEALTIPRTAVLADQGGNYIYVVDGEGKAQQRRVQLGTSTPTSVAVTGGLNDREQVIVEGIQRVRPGQPVSAAPVEDTKSTSPRG